MSMENVNDLARIQYVLDNYDLIQFGGRAEGYSEPRNDGTTMPRRAETIIVGKQVDSTYYVVEAVPDAKKKTVKIVSAFMSDAQKGKEKGAQPLPNVKFTPRSTSKNEAASRIKGTT